MATIREILRECPNRKFSTDNQKLKGTRSWEKLELPLKLNYFLRVFLESSPVSGLGTLFASIVGVTTLGSLIFYILVGCYDGWKSIKEAKKLRVVRP